MCHTAKAFNYWKNWSGCVCVKFEAIASMKSCLNDMEEGSLVAHVAF